MKVRIESCWILESRRESLTIIDDYANDETTYVKERRTVVQFHTPSSGTRSIGSGSVTRVESDEKYDNDDNTNTASTRSNSVEIQTDPPNT